MAATLSSVIVVCVCAVTIVRGYDSMKGPPRAEKSEVRHIAKVGDEVKIVCPVHGHPAPLVTWSRGAEVVDFTWTRFRVNKRQMKIKGVVKADTGSYTCKAINGFGKVEIRVQLVVINPAELTGVSAEDISKLAAPEFSRRTLEEEKSVIRAAGSDVVLRCAVAGGHPAPAISWYKDEAPVPGSAAQDTLRLRALQTRDSGAYSCVARNIIGTAAQTFTLNVRAESSAGAAPGKQLAGPGAEMLGQANISVEEGERATLDCRVEGVHAPSIKWLRKMEGGGGGGDLISVGSDYYRLIDSSSAVSRTAAGEYLSELVLRRARPEDEGMYICFVTSLNGGFNFKPSYLTVVQKSEASAGGVAGAGPDTTLLILIVSISVVTTLLILAAVACLVQRKQKPGAHAHAQDTVSVDVETITPEKPIFRRAGGGGGGGGGVYERYEAGGGPSLASSRLEELLTQSTPLTTPEQSGDQQQHYFISQNYKEYPHPHHPHHPHLLPDYDPYSPQHNIYEVPSQRQPHPPLPHYPYTYYESARLNNSFNSSYSSRR